MWSKTPSEFICLQQELAGWRAQRAARPAQRATRRARTAEERGLK
jgi:hypothetical protein